MQANFVHVTINLSLTHTFSTIILKDVSVIDLVVTMPSSSIFWFYFDLIITLMLFVLVVDADVGRFNILMHVLLMVAIYIVVWLPHPVIGSL